jgi:hypothetical protein
LRTAVLCPLLVRRSACTLGPRLHWASLSNHISSCKRPGASRETAVGSARHRSPRRCGKSRLCTACVDRLRSNLLHCAPWPRSAARSAHLPPTLAAGARPQLRTTVQSCRQGDLCSRVCDRCSRQACGSRVASASSSWTDFACPHRLCAGIGGDYARVLRMLEQTGPCPETGELQAPVTAHRAVLGHAWANPGADVQQSRRRCGPHCSSCQSSPRSAPCTTNHSPLGQPPLLLPSPTMRSRSDCPSARTRWSLWTVSPLVPLPLSSLFGPAELRCAAPPVTHITPCAAVGSFFMQTVRPNGDGTVRTVTHILRVHGRGPAVFHSWAAQARHPALRHGPPRHR